MFLKKLKEERKLVHLKKNASWCMRSGSFF